MDGDDDASSSIDYGIFEKCIKQIASISAEIHDSWQLMEVPNLDNGKYLTYRTRRLLQDPTDNNCRLLVEFEYHIAYSISYSVPILCFIAFKHDGSLLHIDEYRKFNRNFTDTEIMTSLTQLDHPVLCRPFLTLHPCRTADVMAPFMGKR